VSKDLARALTAWKKALANGDPGDQADAANELEAQGKRLAANVYVSPRLRDVKALTDAIFAFSAAAPPQPLIAAYNRAVHAYEDDRDSALRKPVARVLGFDARPTAVKTAPAYSLQRLGVDYIDVYRPARLDPDVPIEGMGGAIKDMIDAGNVRYIGMSEAGA